MERNAKKIQTSTKLKEDTIAIPKSDTGEISNKSKHESSTVFNKESDSKKKEVTSKTNLASTAPKNYISKKVKDEKNQSDVMEPSPTSRTKTSDNISIFENTKPQGFLNITRRETSSPLSLSVLEIRPLVMSVHLVPSLPISLFELLAEAIEAATTRPVVLLYESRADRPVARELVDIAILPASGDWKDGILLPVSFVFEHRLNKEFQPQIYADVVVATDRAPYVESLMDLRGFRCILPDRCSSIGATRLLFNYLKSKGEGPSFFGSNLDVDSQLIALHMITGKQVEVGILESPVIKYHRHYLPGMEKLSILHSLGPLPPYRIMVHKDMPAPIVNKITSYLLKVKEDTEWMEKFSPYSVIGFAPNTKSFYNFEEIKSVSTDSPYY